MIAVVSAGFRLKVLLAVLLVLLTSFLSTSITHYTYTASYRILQTLDTEADETLETKGPNIIIELNENNEVTETNEEVTDWGEPYFKQPGGTLTLVHYDSRYFRGTEADRDAGIVSPEVRRATLHHMIRAYLITTYRLGLETWIAHGTLLGWWWNGHSLPWDFDLDVQVTDKTLWFMGEHLNGSTFTYEEETYDKQGIIAGAFGNTTRTYMLDINPAMYKRTRGVGDNIIDARWIDTSNGLFIDITAISAIPTAQEAQDPTTAAPDQIWECKNEHHYATSSIWPLFETQFEGTRASIPAQYEAVLKDEYGEGALIDTVYNEHSWNAEEGIWTGETEEERLARERAEREGPAAEVRDVDDGDIALQGNVQVSIMEKISTRKLDLLRFLLGIG